MTLEYPPEDYLPLSGIQHFCFCRRQWALIHIENMWEENVLTAQGHILHERADDPFLTEVRGNMVITRAVPVASCILGLSGICDVVEYIPSSTGVVLKGRQGRFQPAPVEYKRGHEKTDHSDEVQLCAQAICLEEMLSVSIPTGYFYYWETRHRVKVELEENLRSLVYEMAKEMHNYYDRGYTPKVKPNKSCRSCSLNDICFSKLQGDKFDVSKYIHLHTSDE